MPIILDIETAGVGGPITCITVDTLEGVDELDIPEGVKVVAVDRMIPTFHTPLVSEIDMLKQFDTMLVEVMLDPMATFRKGLVEVNEALREFGKAVSGINFPPINYDGIVTAAGYHLDDPLWDEFSMLKQPMLSRLFQYDPKPTDDPYDKYKPAEPHDRQVNTKRVARGRARNKAVRKARRKAR